MKLGFFFCLSRFGLKYLQGGLGVLCEFIPASYHIHKHFFLMFRVKTTDCILCCSGVQEVIVVESRNYMRKLVEQANLHFMVTGKVKETGQIVSAMKVVTLHNPQLTTTV